MYDSQNVNSLNKSTTVSEKLEPMFTKFTNDALHLILHLNQWVKVRIKILNREVCDRRLTLENWIKIMTKILNCGLE